MMKTVRFLIGWLAQFYGCMAAVAVGLVLCTILFGQSSFFGNYLYCFPLLFSWLGNIALTQLPVYAQLALGFGSTRRRVMAATAACWLAGAVVGALLGTACGSITGLLFPQVPGNGLLPMFLTIPCRQRFLLGLFGGAAVLWSAGLPNRGALWVVLRITANLLVFAMHMLLALLPLIAAQPGWGWTSWLPAAGAAVSLPVLALALYGQRRLAVTM